ncbi:DNA topoisomerase 1 [Desulfamplus magnetovallimortis]|uniref:DNA topoisomerase 1 n=1 Tax=Desulfamplus magnetovallimortis TaxID=1246637 RepID=A0A1W1H616_9BACT|nr:type I DNA topoisomerase [Desulfamplus magnetovallimortis]SLM27913.1 DNA topoisomerase 1 [Desulfamplus magnetovallimortis]
MSKPLLIVESPTKVKTLKKYLGKKYNVAATAGHIKDLPQKDLGIDIEDDFKAKYITIKGKSKIVQELKKAAGDTDIVYLAPDPDREGEAIAFHAADVLKKKGRQFYRVLIHELTQKGIQEALNSPMELNFDRYEAQQTRRTLDRLVGYQISPLLWRRVQGSLSAGRVQSVAVKIICDREREIRAFEPEEYWSITAHLEAQSPPAFLASLTRKKGKKISIANEDESNFILNELQNSDFIVDRITIKTIKRNPLPPFITSKLQQDAINRLKFSAKKTMIVAQQLYEGIDIGKNGPEGLITYMRTDSTRIAAEAAHEALELIREKFGSEYALDQPRFFKNKSKVQDAHEAIRPTSVFNTPGKVQPFLTPDQFRLYDLIWKRFMASQMAQAIIDQKNISIQASDYTFSVGGSTTRFEGFMALYSPTENRPDDAGKDDNGNDNKNNSPNNSSESVNIDNDTDDFSRNGETESGKMSVNYGLSTTDEESSSKSATTTASKDKQVLPHLEEGMKLGVKEIIPKQHFTKPPPRFSEASLVKELEENGIGRPSTYATILSTIRDKGYVDLVKRYFIPSELGFIVNDLLVDSFPEILDAAFTANMESLLDNIETGSKKSIEVLNEFYQPFNKKLEHAKEHMLSVKGVGIATDLKCPECEKQLNIKIGKNGQFIACTGYPECTFSSNYSRDEKGNIEILETKIDNTKVKDCDLCGKPMVRKEGRYGEFLACTGYPECKHTESLFAAEPAKATDIKCPLEGCDGTIVEKKSRRGKAFFGCNSYPECDFASWDKPVNKQCPECGSTFLVEKETKKEGLILKCPVKGCKYKESQQ